MKSCSGRILDITPDRVLILEDRVTPNNIDTSGIAALANSNFSTIVESINGKPISVQSAIYWSVNGVTWEGGGNTTATRLW